MNIKIKRLINETNGYWEYGDHNMPSAICFQEKDLNAFVERIVSECIQTIHKSDISEKKQEKLVEQLYYTFWNK